MAITHQTPFTAFVKIAVQGQTRLQRLRYAERVATVLYTDLAAVASLTLATPGGGQHNMLQMYNFSNMKNGMQFKPQFGESPAQLVIAGFNLITGATAQPYANAYRILGNRWLAGPVGDRDVTAVQIPKAAMGTEVKTLKTSLVAAINLALASYPDADLKLFRLDYNGIIWGDRGFTFP